MNEAQKALIGLSAEATDEQVTARLTELAASATAGETEGEPKPGTTPANPGGPNPAGPPGDPTAPAPAPPTNPTPPKATMADGSPVPDGMVLVDAATIEDLKNGMQEVRASAVQSETARRKGVVEAALREGKIPRSRREHYDSLMASTDPNVIKTTEEMLAAMPSGLVPVNAEAGTGEFDATDGEPIEAYPAGWLPEVQARAGGERPVIVTEA